MEFHCYYYNDLVFFGYTCNVEKITKLVTNSEILIFTGKHLEGRNNNDDVKHVSIIGQPIEEFPRNLHKIFPNLISLSVAGCNLKKITKEDLSGFEDLEYLCLNANNLTFLPDDLFEGMKKLREVHFDDNQLEFLSSKLLITIESSLKYAGFINNTKIDDFFHAHNKHKDNLMELFNLMDLLKSNFLELS